MIELITPQEWIRSEAFRKEVFSFRYQTFIDRLGWKIRNHDSLEFDEFDALLPVYMVSRNSAGQLNAVWRLLPTNSPYMLKNVFPLFLGDREAPQDEKIWEISRFAFNTSEDGALRIDEFTQVAGNLFCALGEFGLEYGIKEVLALFDSRISPILKFLNCKPIWVGPKITMGGIQAKAASFAVTGKNLAAIRQKISAPEPILLTPQHIKEAA